MGMVIGCHQNFLVSCGVEGDVQIVKVGQIVAHCYSLGIEATKQWHHYKAVVVA